MLTLTPMELIARLRKVVRKDGVTYPNHTEVMLDMREYHTGVDNPALKATITLYAVQYSCRHTYIRSSILIEGKVMSLRQFIALFGKSGVGG